MAAPVSGKKVITFEVVNDTPTGPISDPGDEGNILPVADEPDSGIDIVDDEVKEPGEDLEEEGLQKEEITPIGTAVSISGKNKVEASDNRTVQSDSFKININNAELAGNRLEGSSPDTGTFTLAGLVNEVVEELTDIAYSINTSIEVLGDAIESIERHENIITKTALGGTLTLSAGMATWIFRGGSLVASALSTMPIWKGFDPVHVLPMTGKERREKVRQTRKIEKEERRKNRRITDLFDTTHEQHMKNDEETETS